MMRNYLIGQYGGFDYCKFIKDYRDDFFGIEACLLKSDMDIEYLAAAAKEKDLKIGIHYPLRGGVHKFRDPQFMLTDDCARMDVMNSIEDELKFIKLKHINPSYVLFHYPKPVILAEGIDWGRWKFADNSEFVYEPEYSCDEFLKRSEALFGWLTDISIEYGFTPVLELDAISRYITETSILEGLLDRFDRIRLCLDTARLHFQKLTDETFEPLEVIRRFTKYAEVIHFSNLRIENGIVYAHFPALPGLKTDEGWADMSEYLKIIRQENKNVKIYFEHRSDLITDEELEMCYSWVDKLLNEEYLCV